MKIYSQVKSKGPRVNFYGYDSGNSHTDFHLLVDVEESLSSSD